MYVFAYKWTERVIDLYNGGELVESANREAQGEFVLMES